jgi:hypothetical protein
MKKKGQKTRYRMLKDNTLFLILLGTGNLFDFHQNFIALKCVVGRRSG